jgi:signal transduction histidine kinase
VTDAFHSAMEGFADQAVLMREATHQRRQAERDKTRFLAHLSHELKSPLNSILGFSELMLAELDGPIEGLQREQLGYIWTSGDELLRFILAILDLTRLDGLQSGDDAREQRAAGLNSSPASCTDFVSASAQQHRYDPLGRLKIELITKDIDSLARSTIDADLSARAILLVAASALDPLQKGTIEVQVCVRDDGRIEIRIVPRLDEDSTEQLMKIWRRSFVGTEKVSEEQAAQTQRLSVPLQLLDALQQIQGGSLQLNCALNQPELSYVLPPV